MSSGTGKPWKTDRELQTHRAEHWLSSKEALKRLESPPCSWAQSWREEVSGRAGTDVRGLQSFQFWVLLQWRGRGGVGVEVIPPEWHIYTSQPAFQCPCGFPSGSGSRMEGYRIPLTSDLTLPASGLENGHFFTSNCHLPCEKLNKECVCVWGGTNWRNQRLTV